MTTTYAERIMSLMSLDTHFDGATGPCDCDVCEDSIQMTHHCSIQGELFGGWEARCNPAIFDDFDGERGILIELPSEGPGSRPSFLFTSLSEVKIGKAISTPCAYEGEGIQG